MTEYSGKGKDSNKTDSKKYSSAGSTNYLNKINESLNRYSSKVCNSVKSLYNNLKGYLGLDNKLPQYSFVPAKSYGLEGLVIKDVEERRCPICGSLMINGICPKCVSRQ